MAGLLASSIASARRRFWPPESTRTSRSANSRHVHLLENARDRFFESLSTHAANAQLYRIGDAFPHREILVGDAELRHIADLRRREIVLNKVTSIPIDLAILGAVRDASDDLEQRALSTSRWPKNRRKMAAGECRGDIRNQRPQLAILFNGKGDIAELEHRRSLANAVITFNAKKRSRPTRLCTKGRLDLCSC